MMRDRLRQIATGVDTREIVRYVVNGLVATFIHFTILTFNLQLLQMPSAGMANFIAAFFGIASSYLGSRYYVFRRSDGALFNQASRFVLLYGSIACLHGFILLVWTDWYGFRYQYGFVLATFLQVALSYMGNKFLVFI